MKTGSNSTVAGTSTANTLPRSVEELTPEWLTAAIGATHPGVRVKSMTIDNVIWGTATKVLVSIEHAGSDTLPDKLCIKGEFDERVRKALSGMTMTGTQIEAVFFNDLAPRLGLPLPRHWYGGSEPGMGVLVLDNLAVQGATFGVPATPWSPDLVTKALDVLAILHGSTWKKRFPEISWLQVGSAAVRQAGEFLMSEQHWEGYRARADAFRLPASLADRERSLKALRNMWRYDDENADCVIHGDAHLGNTCVDASGQPFFIDWAGPCYSHWAFDVSTFIVGALTVDDRRATEVDLMRHYVERLHVHGGPKLEWNAAWDDYRRNILNGIIWATLPPTMQPLENVDAMGERFSSALVEHRTLELLGV